MPFLLPDHPCMSQPEIELLQRSFPFGAHVLEFGGGASTKYFFTLGASSVATVEADPVWLQQIQQDPVVRFFHKKQKWFPAFIDIGPTGPWSFPVNSEAPTVAWMDYHRHVWDTLPHEPQYILIDGRFRVACLCQALLRHGEKEIPIFIHDYLNRPYYHVIQNFVEITDSADTAIVCKAQKHIPCKDLALALQEHQLDVR